METTVYRHYAGDVLLYVGITSNMRNRTSLHRVKSPWFSEVNRTEVEVFPDHGAALREETRLIEALGPLHNKGTQVRPGRPVNSNGPARTEVVKIRTTAADRVKLQAAADRAGQPLALWMHDRLVAAEHGDRPAAHAGRVEPERRGGHGDVAGSAPAGEGEGHQRERDGDAADDRGATAADADDDATGAGRQPRHASSGGTEPAERGGVAWGQYEPAIRRWERVTGRTAPSPTEVGPKGGNRLSPRFTEWMMGWPAGWVTDVPGVSRNDALKICGNGVVPQQAAAAIRSLLSSAVAA